jgi:CBS domain-containing membrane protein
MARPMRIEDLMSTAVITVRDTDTIEAAETEMKLGSMRHLPVVDEKQNLIGMLSTRDVLVALAKGKKRVHVGEYMTRKPVTVSPDMPLRRAIDLLLEHHFGSLPVVGTDGHLLGIVTETDFLMASRDGLVPHS